VLDWTGALAGIQFFAPFGQQQGVFIVGFTRPTPFMRCLEKK